MCAANRTSTRTELALATNPFDAKSEVIGRSALDFETILSGQYWGELRTFLAVAKAKSLTKAAESLSISLMTVGREIRRLQDMMGSQLAIISKSGVTLTPRGLELASTLIKLDHTLLSLTNELRAESREAEGIVRVGITDGLGVVFVVPALRQFSLEFPLIQVQLKSPGNFSSLRDNQTDLMIGFGAEPNEDIFCEPLGWLHLIPISSESYIQRVGLPTLANIQNYDFIDSEIYSSQSPIWAPWRALTTRGRVAHLCDTSISYGMMAKAANGIYLLANYNLMEPCAVPLDLNCKISIRLHLIGLRERLEANP
jgi:DNA-binding transcriptional LysR family regulator